MSGSYDKWFDAIVTRLRSDSEDITREPLPRRWVDLIHHLNEQERRPSERHQPELEPHERHSR
jgi:hypothetical protein